jgi:anti-sigma regulatory factor (Ser/Thr protein kinase)
MTALVLWSSDLLLPLDTRSPARARDLVGRVLAEHELAYLVDDVRLVVSELVSNAVVHARSPVRVSMAELLFCVRLTVFDECADPLVVPLAGQPDGDGEWGRGLRVVDACSSDWGTDMAPSGGKSVWALFPVRPISSWVGGDGHAALSAAGQCPRRRTMDTTDRRRGLYP